MLGSCSGGGSCASRSLPGGPRAAALGGRARSRPTAATGGGALRAGAPEPCAAARASRPAFKGRQSPAVVLAGLRVFLAERFGGVREAFDRMDFHHDGRISCLEFQEVMHGQERYCGLQEARNIFCSLARGTSGSLTWEDFRERLGSNAWADTTGRAASEPVEDRGGRGSWPRLLAKAGGLAGGLVCGGEAPGEADDTATTARTLTSRSSQSVAAGVRPARVRSPAAAPPTADPPGDAAGRNWSDDVAGLAAQEPSPHSTDALGSRTRWQGQCSLPQDGSAQSLAIRGGASCRFWCTDTVECGVDGMGTVAIQKLDEGLSSLRAEVAALDALRAGSGTEPHSVIGHQAVPSDFTRSSCTLTIPACMGQEQVSLLAPAGLCWVRQLPRQVQGRLAACLHPTEALEVLDLALDRVGQSCCSQSGHSRRSCSAECGRGLARGRSADAACIDRWRPEPEPVPSAQDAEAAMTLGLARARPEVVAASAELLRGARAQAAYLEAELEARQRRHEARVTQARRRHRDEGRQSLRRLLARLVPCPHEPCGSAGAAVGPVAPALQPPAAVAVGRTSPAPTAP